MRSICVALLFSALCCGTVEAGTIRLSTGLEVSDKLPMDAALDMIADASAAYFSGTNCVNPTAETLANLDLFIKIVASMKEYLELRHKYNLRNHGLALLKGRETADQHTSYQRRCSTDEFALIDNASKELLSKLLFYR